VASSTLDVTGDQLVSKAEHLKHSTCSCDTYDEESSTK
jgi:hypothetical protein